MKFRINRLSTEHHRLHNQMLLDSIPGSKLEEYSRGNGRENGAIVTIEVETIDDIYDIYDASEKERLIIDFRIPSDGPRERKIPVIIIYDDYIE